MKNAKAKVIHANLIVQLRALQSRQRYERLAYLFDGCETLDGRTAEGAQALDARKF